MESNKISFTDMQIDAIGEILNISMGSSATSVSGMLDKRVVITTPAVKVMKADEFHFESYEPAIGVEINYIDGLSGTNVMILKESDVKTIVGLLLQIDYSEQEFVMDEMSISAICEVMNQMMGASATALSQFLNRSVNITTPESFPIDDSEQFRKKYYGDKDTIVSVYFKLTIEDLVDSEFISVLSVDLAKELVSMFDVTMETPQEPEPAPQPVVQQAPPVQQQPVYAEPVQSAPVQQPAPQMQQPVQRPRNPDPQPNYEVRSAPMKRFDDEESILTTDQTTNLNLIMSVPLQISVEIGRTKKQIKNILEFTEGSIIELNKQAGAQVDILVNGQPIAKGDVVVVEEFYGVRITEILSSSEIIKML